MCSCALVLAGCGGTTHMSAGRPKRVEPPFSVRLSAQTHRPLAGRRWHYEVRVADRRGRPLRALVHLQILFGGTPVGQVGRHRVTGVWQETLGTPGNPPFPAAARGQPLAFEAVVTADGKTVRRSWWLRVR